MKKSILVVDDEFEVGQAVLSILEDEGYEVDYASDGLDAKERIAKKTPDLIISDVMMPRCSGIQLMVEIRTDPKRKDIPIILMSAAPVKEAQASNAFLRKPFNIELLLETVEKFLS